mmetsp:Transcript_107629/g.160986  ORF Transcript_107629/g.160986 Transcript_107629/m.160986 type:complete len:176 (-) Transcript_107629:253-780(-)
MPQQGKLWAMVTIVLGLASIAASAYVLWNCEFYEVVFNDETGTSQMETPGLFACKYIGDELFEGPTNPFDMMTTVCGFLAPFVGMMALILTINSYWKCVIKCKKDSAAPSCLYMMAVLAQGATALVLVTKACREEQAGECKLLTNGYISMGACGGYFLTSCTARNIAAGYGEPKE